MDPSLVLLSVALAAIVALLFSPPFLSRLRHAEEKGLTPLYEEWCAVHRDTATWSSMGKNLFLWRVTFYPGFMVIALFSQDLIPYQEVAGVQLKDFQSSKEVWLRRQLKQGNEFITIKSNHADRIVEILASVGISSMGAPRSNVSL